jgi:hypothetical protein
MRYTDKISLEPLLSEQRSTMEQELMQSNGNGEKKNDFQEQHD